LHYRSNAACGVVRTRRGRCFELGGAESSTLAYTQTSFYLFKNDNVQGDFVETRFPPSRFRCGSDPIRARYRRVL